ncbi:SDR family NAD(P)-dependent oxidoreductase [Stutzerimonas stutzeri]|uniref:SDR family NAD(P)-dependent oxidoreductase n=1 Tax=Stutzerimonas stutzeri TaxID=316 RepID=UPI00210E894C|nr:SDR family NAD(P)-dependent oxidoreductase [Stutzerimonas stutzeri]MCQ4321087.1 SDR family NAD(P)-dependent oxidoreductase [Stutzerimonas stutzeri]
MYRVKNKVALVTGGAVGLGKAIAESLADEGAKVVITDLKEKEGREVVKGIEKKGGEALFIKQDVSQEEEWKRVVKKTLDTFGRLDVLVNNAGVAVSGSVEETTLDEWRWLMSVNLDGVFLGTREAVLAMKGNENGGSIINLSSIEGLVGDPNLAAYNSSKGGGAAPDQIDGPALREGRVQDPRQLHPPGLYLDSNG